jgi:hypothetical protein
MSFALEFRKKLQQREAETLRIKKANEGFVSMPVDSSTDTSNNRRRVLLALVIAGGVLSIFNSGGLVRYTQGLADNPVGPVLIIASEKWHALMQEKQATLVVDHIRGSVAMVRDSSWRDLTFGLRLTQDGTPPNVLPAGQEIPYPPEPEEPRIAKPVAPVMRASVEPRP